MNEQTTEGLVAAPNETETPELRPEFDLVFHKPKPKQWRNLGVWALVLAIGLSSIGFIAGMNHDNLSGSTIPFNTYDNNGNCVSTAYYHVPGSYLERGEGDLALELYRQDNPDVQPTYTDACRVL